MIAAAMAVLLSRSTAEGQRIFEPGEQVTRDEAQRRKQLLERRVLEQEKRSRQSVVEDEETGDKGLPPEATRPVIDLVRVDVDPSEILSADEVEAVVAPYLGKKVSLADLYAIVGGIDQLYRAKGYITAKANLPPQKVAGGVVRIQLIEARVGAVQYEGNRFTRRSFLERRLPLPVGELVDVRRAEALLRRFNRINDIVANLVLSPGKEAGTTDLRVKVDEPPQLVVDLALDNYGPTSTGTARRGLSVSTPSLTGLRDPLSVGGYMSDGVEAVFASYEIPLTPSDTRISVSGDYNQSTSRFDPSEEDDDDEFVFDGDAYSVSLSLSHPLYVSTNTFLRGYLAGYRRVSDLDVVGANFRLVKTDLWSGEAGLYAERLDGQGLWVTTAIVERVFDRTDSGDGFVKVSGSAARHQRVIPGVWAVARVNGQVVGERGVPGVEAFQAGGAFTVRGYPEAFTIADNGYLASVQLNGSVPLPESLAKPLTEVRLFAFADHAGLVGADSDDDLSSVGAGTYVSLSQSVTVEVAVGVPLTDRREIGVGDLEAHFAVHFTPPVSRWLGWSS